MKIERNFTDASKDAYAALNFKTTTSEIRNPDGTIVFKLDDCEIPQDWSQVASDVIAQCVSAPCGKRPIRCARAVAGMLFMSVPSTLAVPTWGFKTPARHDSKVDLPAPLGPRIQTSSPRPKCKLSSWCNTFTSFFY